MSHLPYSESDSEQSEDSDAEFLVHPILRSLIKSKSAYSMPKSAPTLRTSKTAFEINLSKMWESAADEELPVANFTPELDQKWPEPDAPSPLPPKWSSPTRKASCWSSPANVYLDDISSPRSPLGESACWSAPECLDQNESEGDEPPPHPCFRKKLNNSDFGATGSFLDSYPLIESGQQGLNLYSNKGVSELGPEMLNKAYMDFWASDEDHRVPSLCSVRIPSGSSTSSESPSPPRPFSPVLGRPPVRAVRVSGSRSMQLRPRPELSSFVDNSTDDDDSPQHDPWPQQEVANSPFKANAHF
ncbi:unnamed protein product [Heligmosomoides polygyrus]|uniref:Protein aurora borealis n=1 Tax=Heligmosomoides polygyrus TaxID=6339 RepID=A0A3P8EBP0_HELPZ|nr:unnamed protein product [Heligmosomoides polygyrus]